MASTQLEPTGESANPEARAATGTPWRDRKAPPPEQPLTDVDAVFMDVALEVGQGVVTPRLETELLVTEALVRMEAQPQIATVLDMCCGCGAVALALAKRNPDIRIWAGDLLEAAAAVTRRNVRRHHLDDRVRVACGDLFAAFAADGLEGRVDLIVANPPYISTGRRGARLSGARRLAAVRVRTWTGTAGVGARRPSARLRAARLRARRRRRTEGRGVAVDRLHPGVKRTGKHGFSILKTR